MKDDWNRILTLYLLPINDKNIMEYSSGKEELC